MTTARSLRVLRAVAGFAVPTALFYGLRAMGVGIYLTLVIASVLPALLGLWTLLRSRKVDGLALYMLVLMLLSTGVSLIGGSPRFLLSREAWLTGVTGAWFIGSVWTARPLAFHYTRPMLEHRKGRAAIPGDWDDLWERLPGFRRVWRVGSVLWGVALLADSAVRVVMAYTLPVDEVPALGTALYLATSVVLIVITNVYYFASGLYDRRSSLYAPPAAENS
ncbi:VC0807 family protein [Streptacidiphilus rugosus]|uniref:VC0807 family protein n=1 Tax=Streptacidiphilus rugosus TaxID=405783 RepID=UPI0006894546|nr:VC0807 family protein [Streptacidiphilus rugosus]